MAKLRYFVQNWDFSMQNWDFCLKLTKNPDIVATIAANKKENQKIIGFCLTDKDLINCAKNKLKNKNLDFIIANDVSKSDRGFGSNDNAVTILKRSGEREDIELRSKAELAEILIDKLCCWFSLNSV